MRTMRIGLTELNEIEGTVFEHIAFSAAGAFASNNTQK